MYGMSSGERRKTNDTHSSHLRSPFILQVRQGRAANKPADILLDEKLPTAGYWGLCVNRKVNSNNA